MKHKLAVLTPVALLSLAGLGFAAWMALEPTNERTRLLFRDPQGGLTSGSQLDVHVGDPWRKADATLRDQFEPRYVLWQVGERNDVGGGVAYPDGPVLTGEAEVVYRDGSWRNGHVALDLRDGVVVAISWHYSGPFYIDL